LDVFVYILSRFEKAVLAKTKKFPAPGTQEEDFVLPRISRPLQNGEVPDKISFSSFLFGLTTDFFSVSLATDERERVFV
jgi:hypothetical protein